MSKDSRVIGYMHYVMNRVQLIAQLTSIRLYAPCRSRRLCGQAVGHSVPSGIGHRGLRQEKLTVRLRTIKHTAPGSPNRLTCTVTNSCHASSINTQTLHTPWALRNGPTSTGIGSDNGLSYQLLLPWSPQIVEYSTVHFRDSAIYIPNHKISFHLFIYINVIGILSHLFTVTGQITSTSTLL